MPASVDGHPIRELGLEQLARAERFQTWWLLTHIERGRRFICSMSPKPARTNRTRTSMITAGKKKSPQETLRSEAVRIAKDALASRGEPIELSYLTAHNVGKHRVCRERPLRAWAVRFKNDVSVFPQPNGWVGGVRTEDWRILAFSRCSTRWILWVRAI